MKYLIIKFTNVGFDFTINLNLRFLKISFPLKFFQDKLDPRFFFEYGISNPVNIFS